MDSHGNRDHSARLFSREENDDLAQRRHALHTTMRNTPEAPALDLGALEIIQDGYQFNTAFARSDAKVMMTRRQMFCFSSLRPNELILARDTNGKVIAPAYGHVLSGCRDRQFVLLASLALVLLWKAVELLASCFRAYEVHVAWTLVGVFLGVNKQTLGNVFFAVCAFVRAPFATLRSIYNMEMEFRGRLQEEATLMRSIRRQPNTSTGWTSKSSFHTRLCFCALVESAAFHIAGVEMGFGLCCLYFVWFTALSVFGV